MMKFYFVSYFVFGLLLCVFGSKRPNEIQKRRIKHISTKVYKPTKEMYSKYLSMIPPRFPPTFIHTRLRVPYEGPERKLKWKPPTLYVKSNRIGNNVPVTRTAIKERWQPSSNFHPSTRKQGTGDPSFTPVQQKLKPKRKLFVPTVKPVLKQRITTRKRKYLPKTDPVFTTTIRPYRPIRLFEPVTSYIPPDVIKVTNIPPSFTKLEYTTTYAPFIVSMPNLKQLVVDIKKPQIQKTTLPPKPPVKVTTTRPTQGTIDSRPSTIKQSLPPIILIRPRPQTKTTILPPIYVEQTFKTPTLPPIVVPPMLPSLFEEAQIPPQLINESIKRVAKIKPTTPSYKFNTTTARLTSPTTDKKVTNTIYPPLVVKSVGTSTTEHQLSALPSSTTASPFVSRTTTWPYMQTTSNPIAVTNSTSLIRNTIITTPSVFNFQTTNFSLLPKDDSITTTTRPTIMHGRDKSTFVDITPKSTYAVETLDTTIKPIVSSTVSSEIYTRSSKERTTTMQIIPTTSTTTTTRPTTVTFENNTVRITAEIFPSTFSTNPTSVGASSKPGARGDNVPTTTEQFKNTSPSIEQVHIKNSLTGMGIPLYLPMTADHLTPMEQETKTIKGIFVHIPDSTTSSDTNANSITTKATYSGQGGKVLYELAPSILLHTTTLENPPLSSAKTSSNLPTTNEIKTAVPEDKTPPIVNPLSTTESTVPQNNLANYGERTSLITSATTTATSPTSNLSSQNIDTTSVTVSSTNLPSTTKLTSEETASTTTTTLPSTISSITIATTIGSSGEHDTTTDTAPDIEATIMEFKTTEENAALATSLTTEPIAAEKIVSTNINSVTEFSIVDNQTTLPSTSTKSTSKVTERTTEVTQGTTERTTDATKSTTEKTTEVTESTTERTTEVTDGTTEIKDVTESTTGRTPEVTESTLKRTTEVTDGATERKDVTESTTERTIEVTERTTEVTEGTTERTTGVTEVTTEVTEGTTERTTDISESTKTRTESTSSKTAERTEITTEKADSTRSRIADRTESATESKADRTTKTTTESTADKTTEETKERTEITTERTDITAERSENTTRRTIERTEIITSPKTIIPNETTTKAQPTIYPTSCKAIGCPKGRECITANNTLCMGDAIKNDCFCKPGCRLENMYVELGQPVVIDRCGNLCYCSKAGLTACTKIPCTGSRYAATTPNPFKPVEFKPDVKDRGPTRGDSPYFYVDNTKSKSVKVHGLHFPEQLLAWLSPFSSEFRDNLPSSRVKEISIEDLFKT